MGTDAPTREGLIGNVLSLLERRALLTAFAETGQPQFYARSRGAIPNMPSVTVGSGRATAPGSTRTTVPHTIWRLWPHHYRLTPAKPHLTVRSRSGHSCL